MRRLMYKRYPKRSICLLKSMCSYVTVRVLYDKFGMFRIFEKYMATPPNALRTRTGQPLLVLFLLSSLK
jgi:hypothetical protein